MTARTSAPPSPEEHAAAFAHRADVIVARTLTRSHREIDRRATRFKLVQLVGGGWQLACDGSSGCESIGTSRDPELAAIAHRLCRIAVAQLDVRSRAKLMELMCVDTELPGHQPPHFCVQLMLEGATWTLRVAPNVRGSGCTVATFEGALESAQQAA